MRSALGRVAGCCVTRRHLRVGDGIEILRGFAGLRHFEATEFRHEAAVGIFLTPVGGKIRIAFGFVVVRRSDASVLGEGRNVGIGANIRSNFGIDALFHALEMAWLIDCRRFARDGHGHRRCEGQLNVFTSFHLRLPADQLDGVMHAALSMPTLIATAAT